MKAFRFPLQKVLDWRKLQLRSEEEKLAFFRNNLALLLHRDNALRMAQLKAETAVREMASISGSELRALAEFQARVRTEHAALKASRRQCESQIVEQHKRLLKARKDCRILEKLKDERYKEWLQLSNRETEETAAESYLSNWLRSTAD